MYEIKRKQRNKQTKKNNSHGYYRTTAYPTFSGAKSNYPPGKSPMSSFTSSIVVYLKFWSHPKIYEPPFHWTSFQNRGRPSPTYPLAYLHLENQIRVSWKFNHSIPWITTSNNTSVSTLKGYEWWFYQTWIDARFGDVTKDTFFFRK